MPHYLVTWVIDIEDAETPMDAAQRALAIHRKTDSIATVFEVKDKATGKVVKVDLNPEWGDGQEVTEVQTAKEGKDDA